MAAKKALFTSCLFCNKDIELLKKIGVEVKKASGNLREKELIRELQDCTIYIIGGADKASAEVIRQSNLELIVFYGTGYEDHVDMKATKKKRIPVCNTPKANAYTVAEHAVALILDSVKQITYLNNTTKAGRGVRRQAWNLENMVLGIVGMGTIGGKVARIMNKAFKTKVLYVSRERKKTWKKNLEQKKWL
ncbi:MAG TPA: NAD(P)-dependent oxidoreductase [Candidatus Bathyarchaeia archaeon]|nr:NAD(P)-dependent oxidoreductase [Candidatus Bathyarchaeia archaeon]